MTTRAEPIETVPAPLRTHVWRRIALSFVLTITALAVLGITSVLGYWALNADKVLPGVSVAGVSLAGLERGEAEAELRRVLPDLGAGSLTLSAGGQEESIPYAAIGRDYQMALMLDQAFAIGRQGGFVDQLQQQVYTGTNGVDVAPAMTWDAGALARRVDALAASAEVTPVDATVTYADGDYAFTPSSEGQTVDVGELRSAAMAAVNSLSAADTSVTAEASVIPVQVTTAQARAAVERVESVFAGPLSVSAASTNATVPASTIEAWVRLEETGMGEWTVVLDRAPIEQYVAGLKSQVDVISFDARFTFENGRAMAVPGQVGRSLEAEEASDMIHNALLGRAGGTGGTGVTLPVTTLVPEFTDEEAQDLVGRVKRLGHWTTRYVPSVSNFNGINIRRPTSLIDGYVVEPGATFDFIEVAGPITRANGYGEGAAIIRGNTRPDGVLGGGLCSCSTTLFNAALRAGFEMGARRNHAYYINRYPVGLDATIWISGNYRQTMSFTNDTDYAILIRGINARTKVTFEIFGVDDGRTVEISDARVRNEKEAENYYMFSDDLAPGQRERKEYAADGFDATVTRTVRDANGTVIHQDTFNSGYRRVNGIIMLGRYPGDPRAGTTVLVSEYTPRPPGDAPPEAPTPE